MMALLGYYYEGVENIDGILMIKFTDVSNEVSNAWNTKIHIFRLLDILRNIRNANNYPALFSSRICGYE